MQTNTKKTGNYGWARQLLLGWVISAMLTGSAGAWWDTDWTIRKKITIDTAAAAIGDPAGTSAILVRLHEGNYQFASGKEDGSDIRFLAADEKTQLTYHIEKYDAMLGEAFVWVKVPDVNPATQTSIWLYSGNTGNKALAVQDAKATYDENTVLVYHFGERTQPPQDASGNGNHAQTTGLQTDGSLIGGGLRLDGKTSLTVPGSPSLAWTDGASMTWMAWIKPAAAIPKAVLYSRHEGASTFRIGVDNGVPYVQVGTQSSQPGAALTPGSWVHLAVTASGSTITLYVNGAAYATLNAGLPSLSVVSFVGGDTAGGETGFNGELDELEISRIARPAGFIKLAAIGQGPDAASKLLVAGQDEVHSSPLETGYVGVILKSVTIDGWVVIFILAILSLVSWVVMVMKFFFLQRITTGDKVFMKVWRQIASDLTILDSTDPEAVKTLNGLVDAAAMKKMKESPLYRIYHIGAGEISHRIASPAFQSRGLTPQSIQAIRSSLDGTYVRETHALNARLVFLTISIAGGPFLGLLGTVVGVMITFAAIASSGEVNVNAIAPGIAAALAATVAGLLVAIPALLGYNYLTSNIKTVTSDMQVFIDEFVTKMAEFYQPQG